MINFEALKKGKLSVVEIVFEIELPITVLLGVLVFQEILSAVQLIAIAMVFLGIVMISLRGPGKRKWKLEAGVLMGIITAVGYAFVNFFTAVGSRQISPIMIIWFPWLVFSLICLGLIWKREGFHRLSGNARGLKYLVLAMGIIDTLAWLFYSIALSNAGLSVATAITESYPAIALFLGYWLNKERLHSHQFIGALVAISASLSLVLVA